MIADILDFCSLHIYYIYLLVGKVYYVLLMVISSLFRLFRGVKKNTLKNRIDSGEFGVDEVLLGALIFTAIIFLYPTIAMYYLCFVSLWIAV